MKPATWRALLLTACAIGILLVAVEVFDQVGFGGRPPWYGVWGGYFSGSAQPYHFTFRGLDPGGPADRAGVHEGDLVDIRGHALVERLSFMGQPLAGRPVAFHIRRGAAQTQKIVVPGRFALPRFWNYTLWELAAIWLLLFAALIAWRRPYADNNLLLCTVLACGAIGFASRSVLFGWPSAWPYVLLAVIGQAKLLSVALWALLASSFARPLSAARRAALGLCCAAVALSIVFGSGATDDALGIVPLIGTVTQWVDPTRFFGQAWTLPANAAIITATLCSIMAIAAAHGINRQRAAWLLIPLCALYLSFAATNLAIDFMPYASVLIIGQSYSVAAIIAPVVLSHAVFNRRLVDAGFVLNRTVVFAIVSTIVIGIFVLVEWAVGTWFVNASHTTSVVTGMVVALCLGLSMRFIHRYVDAIVDRVFFRKRHEDESALRRFAYEASYVNDVSTLLERTIATVRAHTAAEVVEVFIRNGTAGKLSQFFAGGREISENDPLIVALAAWNKPVDVHGISGPR